MEKDEKDEKDEKNKELDFDRHPDGYRHWGLQFDGEIARLTMAVREDEPLRPGYVLKLNSYDLGVDLELADAVNRIRFEHPEVKTVVVTGDPKKDKVFCAGANIHMLAASKHPFKVNFCKFTNETRLAIEDASAHSGIKWLAALNGACAGGGYELALACDEIVLCDDGSSTVSLPEVPLLGVLPGTGGLTRLVDKRKVRRDHADVFCTVAEGMRGKRAVDWRLVDATVPRSRFEAAIGERAKKLAATVGPTKQGLGMKLEPVRPYRFVTLAISGRVADLTVQAPSTREEMLRAFRELDDALLGLRFNHEDVGLVTIRTRGDAAAVLVVDAQLAADLETDWRAREIALLVGRVLRRLDDTAKSIFAVIDAGSCFAGTLLELALAADRAYMLEADGVSVRASLMNGGRYPCAQGSSRLALRFLHTPSRTDEVLAGAIAEPLGAADAAGSGFATVIADEIDFAGELRVAIEERISLSPDALTGLEQNLRFAGAESVESKIFGRLSAWQNWIFIRPNATGERGALTMYGKPERPQFDPEEDLMLSDEKIPNNVHLSSDKRLQRALEQWQPSFLRWWQDVGPVGFQADDVYLRTAISVESDGWAHFDYVKMPDYRWGIFRAPDPNKTIGFGDHMGQPAWQEVPGEHRNNLRRIIVTQGDTEPASVEQQRLLGKTAPSLYDLRNLFQVNVEEGRHLWAMVYLLHTYFGRDGREEAEMLLERRSGDADKPRILGAFNQPIENWLDFFMFTMFTDRDGKYQLYALAESGFDPLARTCRFMITEEAHHMFVGETGVDRVVARSAELSRAGGDARAQGGIDLPTLQKYVNLWFTLSLDLFGGEISSNAADFFASGLKGRFKEGQYEDHRALGGTYAMDVMKDGALAKEDVPLRNAMNEVLRDGYVEDCQRAVDKWNRTIERIGSDFRLRLPHRRFHRQIGLYAKQPFDIDGKMLAQDEWSRRRDEWLPSAADRAYVDSMMQGVREPGKIAAWIAPPSKGINGKPFEFEYVKRA